MTIFPEKSLEILHVSEPLLEFGYQQKTPHPKDGLFLFGPYMGPKKVKEVRIGLLGTAQGIEHFRKWAASVRKAVEVPAATKTEKKDRLHLSAFPGIEETFKIGFDSENFVTYVIDGGAIDRASRIVNLHEAVGTVVELYRKKAAAHHNNEEANVELWILISPELISERCRPQAKRAGLPMERGTFHKRQKARSDLPLLSNLIDHESEAIFEDVPDFHRQVKAAFLKLAPTQILRETTIAPEAFKNKAGYPLRVTQDPATIAWNITTGFYYKTQPMPPWRLFDARPGVCYVGLVYKNLPNDPNDHACCAAQMFLSEGDGVVFRGANGPWKTKEREYHLNRLEAKSLIAMVLDTYVEKYGSPPLELFIHGKTYFNDEEWQAFEDAAPIETNVVGVRIRTTQGETKLFRNGDYPVLRGTALLLDAKNAYFWTTGYIPQLDTYIGPETPNPLFITLLRGRYGLPKIETVLRDILGLTKINYNSCNFNDGLPVTVRFAEMVGDVLVMGSAKGTNKQPFKFYV